MELVALVLKLLVAFTVVLTLMFLLYRVSDTKVKQFGSTKYIKILERTQISKDASLLLVVMGNDGYVMSSTSQKIEIIKELSQEEMNEYKEKKEQFNYENIMSGYLKKKQKDENYE